jgi:hypothetical protein
MRRLRCAAALVVVLAFVAGCSSDPAATPEPVERVLVVSLPGVTWGDVQQHDLPNLERLIDRSAVGAVSTRIGRAGATTTSAYLTLGAGTRAVIPPVDTAVALNPDELHAGIPASDLMLRRLGKVVDAIAYIPVGAAIDVNERSPFGARPGMLGDALDDAGVHRAVIANADAAEGFPVDEPPPDGAYARSAATMLMGSDGVVPGGSVGRGLLIDDPEAAFGRTLDQRAVLDTFDTEWDRDGSSVVLVEASDLARVSAYAYRSTPSQARDLRAQALQDADELLGGLLERVDPERDAVVVLAPVSRTTLGIATLASPDVDGGYLRSASTRRDGYVYLADVAPTLLELVGSEPPTDIEGRPFDVAAASGDRLDHLAGQVADAGVRDARLPLVVPLIVALLAGLALAVVKRASLPGWAARALRPAAMTCLGLVPGTFLAGIVPATRTSDLAYLAVMVGTALVVGAVSTLIDRRHRGLGAIVAVGTVAATIGIDVLLGGRLQVNAVFGYSMAVAGRYTGLGNLAFALFSASVVCLAVLVYERWGPAVTGAIAAGLGVAVLIDGLPMLGADVGGVLSLVPALILTVLALTGRRIGWRELLGALLAGAVVVGVFGLIDASRPAAAETHLARIGQQLLSGRLDSVATTLLRRLQASFGAEATFLWFIGLGLVGLALVQAAALGRGWVGADRTRRTATSAGTVALVLGMGALAVLGLVANDSSIAVPATMLIVLVPVLALRETGPTGPNRAAEPSP